MMFSSALVVTLNIIVAIRVPYTVSEARNDTARYNLVLGNISPNDEESDDQNLDQSATSIPLSIEILEITIPRGIGNTLKLVWGRNLSGPHLNFTYVIHYGTDKEDLLVSEPKLTTNNLTAVIENLEFCTKYNFAVSVANRESEINPNNIRSIVTYIDRRAPPENLQVDFEPKEDPCLLIKWSASCTNIGQPIGYVISAFERSSARYTIVTLPSSKQLDFIYHFKVNYGSKFDIKVSTNFPGSQTTDTVEYQVPNFLQPFKVRVTSNPDGAFLIYWSEPFVPYYIDRVYYEVYIYRGTNITGIHEKYYVTRPALVYKGNESEYTFSVGLVSYDQQYRSLLTNPIVANLNGDDTRPINVS